MSIAASPSITAAPSRRPSPSTLLLLRCCRAVIFLSLDAWFHHRCPFRIAVALSIAVAVALPSCRPSPPSLVDCCRFHRHRRVNVYPPLLPLRSLCCACHRRPSLSRHPSPPSLVDCCIFHVHCCIAVHYRAAHHRRASPAAASTLLQSLCRCRAVHCRHSLRRSAAKLWRPFPSLVGLIVNMQAQCVGCLNFW